MKTVDYQKSGNGGIGFLSALAILFIGLKLGNVIHWPWLWVLAPIWLPAVAFIIFITICAIIAWLVIKK